MSEDLIRIAQVQDRWQQAYPNALLFSPVFIAKLLALVADPTSAAPNTPAIVVARHLLIRDWVLEDFQLRLTDRHLAHHGTRRLDPQTLQGYIDFVSLYVATATAHLRHRHPFFLDEMLDTWSQFHQLPDEVRLRSDLFLDHNAAWALQTFHSGAGEAQPFADQVVERGIEQGRDPAYVAGLRMARDTLLLHVALLQALQTGQLDPPNDQATPAV